MSTKWLLKLCPWLEHRARWLSAAPRLPRRRLTFEPLESRRMLAVQAVFSGGLLTVAIDSTDTVVIDSPAGNVRVNGLEPTGGPVPLANLTGLSIDAIGNFANTIDLSGLGTPSVSLLGDVQIDAGDGDDLIALGNLVADNVAIDAQGGGNDWVAIHGPLQLRQLSVHAETIEFGGGTIDATGPLFFSGAALLTDDLVIDTGTSGAANVTFASSINSTAGPAQGLTINAGGVTELFGAVGDSLPVSQLQTAAGNLTLLGGNMVRATQSLRFGDSVLFLADATLDAPQIVFGQSLSGAPLNTHQVTLQASNGILLETTPTSGSVGADFATFTVLGSVSSPGNQAPVAILQPTLTMDENASPQTLNLWSMFDDDFEPDHHLQYMVVGNTFPSVVPTPTIQPLTGNLVVAAALHAFGSGALTIRATDAAGKFSDLTLNVEILPINDPPVVSVPLQVAAASGLAVPINGLSVSDLDAGTAAIRVVLSVQHGNLRLDTTVASGLSSGQIVGNGTGLVVVTAPLAAIHATWTTPSALQYTSDGDYLGSDALTINANDLGNTGNTAQSDTDSVAIVVGIQAVFGPPGHVSFAGTSTDDVVSFVRTLSGVEVTINSVTSSFAAITSFAFDGLAGFDTITVFDATASGADQYRFEPGRLTITGPGMVATILAESLTAQGGTGDTAQMFGNGSPAIFSTGLTLTNGNLSSTVSSFSRIFVYGQSSDDRATMFDTLGNDIFYLRNRSATHVRPDGSQLMLVGFEQVIAIRINSGNDRALLYDTPGNDQFVFTPSVAQMVGPGSHLVAYNFPQVYAYASVGRDLATMYDSFGNDSFYGFPTHSILNGLGFFGQARNFDAAVSISLGGYDIARLYDSPGSDYFYGSVTNCVMSNPSYYNQVFGYESVYAIANAGGRDFAYIIGSRNTNRISAQGERFTLVTPEITMNLLGIEEVNFTAPAGSMSRRQASALAFLLRTQGLFRS